MGSIRTYLFISLVFLSCGRRDKIPKKDVEAIRTTFIKGGNFLPFADSSFSITIPDLEVMEYEVTNQSFMVFVNATGYITTAEKRGEGMVFSRKEKKWVLTKGANWKNPQGQGSSVERNEYHPVVQISQEDACAYCDWLEMRLPTEVEWEYIFDQDKKSPPGSKNIWQGIFPVEDKGEDGFKGSSPVGYFGKGGSGCYDLQGNVWERCSDYFHSEWPKMAIELEDSSRYFGPPVSYSEQQIFDTLTVIKGGSFICADNYCRGYENVIRMGADPQLGYEHIGFRCVRQKKSPQ